MQGKTANLANPAGFHEVNGRAVEKQLEEHAKPPTNEDLAVKLGTVTRMTNGVENTSDDKDWNGMREGPGGAEEVLPPPHSPC